MSSTAAAERHLESRSYLALNVIGRGWIVKFGRSSRKHRS